MSRFGQTLSRCGLLWLGLSTGCGDGLVGSRCIDGYVAEGDACVLAPSPEPPPPVILAGDGGTGGEGSGGGGGEVTRSVVGSGGSAGGGGSGGGEGCEPPLVDCGGACVDTTNDPDHCGACFDGCPTGLCEASVCVGALAGHIVAIGMDYQESTPVAETLLANAVFLPPAEPLRVLRYAGHASHTAVVNVGRVLAQQSVLRNRPVELLSATGVDDVSAQLAGTGADAVDVLLVHHQASAPAGALSVTGGAWESPIAEFTAGGGVVVVLASTEGTDEMPQLLGAASMFDVLGQLDVTGQTAHNVGWLDALGQGVLSPFATKKAAASFLTDEVPSPSLSHVIVSEQDDPIVLHRVVTGAP